MKFLKNNTSSKIYNSIFGYDVFISYSRKDSLDYAYSISKYLLSKGYECYIDQLSSINPGRELPANIQKAIIQSSAFILIGSEAAGNSSPIQDEINLFLNNNKNKPLIPITIDESINQKSIWFTKIDGLALVNDSNENLSNGKPSSAVLDRIINALSFTKKSIRLRNISLITFLSVIAFISIAIALSSYFVYTANNEAQAAVLKKEKADSLTLEAINEKEVNIEKANLAKLREQQAKNQLRLTEDSLKIKEKAILEKTQLLVKQENNLAVRLLLNKALELEAEDPSRALSIVAEILSKFKPEKDEMKSISELYSRNIYYKKIGPFHSSINDFFLDDENMKLYIATDDSLLEVRDIMSNKSENINLGHTSKILKLELHKSILFSASNEFVIAFSLISKKVISKIKVQSSATSLKYSEELKYLFVGFTDGIVSLYPFNNNVLSEDYSLKCQKGKITSIDISPNLEYFVTSSGQYKSGTSGFALLDIETDFETNVFSLKTKEKYFTVSTNAKWLDKQAVFTFDNNLLVFSEMNRIDKYDLRKKVFLGSIDGHTSLPNVINSMKYMIVDKSRNFIVSATSTDNIIRIFDIESGTELYQLKGNSSPSEKLFISKKLNYIVSKPSQGKYLYFWNTNEYFPSEIYERDILYSLPYTKNQEEIKENRSVYPGLVTPKISFSLNDSNVLISWYRSLAEFERSSKKILNSYNGHTHQIKSINYIEGMNNTIISIGEDGSIVWVNDSLRLKLDYDLLISDDKKMVLSNFKNQDSISIFKGDLNIYNGKIPLNTKVQNFFERNGKIYLVVKVDSVLRIWNTSLHTFIPDISVTADNVATKSTLVTNDHLFIRDGNNNEIKVYSHNNYKVPEKLIKDEPFTTNILSNYFIQRHGSSSLDIFDYDFYPIQRINLGYGIWDDFVLSNSGLYLGISSSSNKHYVAIYPIRHSLGKFLSSKLF